MTPCSGGGRGLRSFAITLTFTPLCFLPLHRYAAKADGYTISRRWLEKFRKRHNIVVQKVQRRTKLSDAERDARLQRFYAFLYLQPSAVRVWVNLDEIPASLGGLLGNVETLEHEASRNVMALADENHFKRMGALIAMLGVKKEGDAFSTLDLKPAVLLKSKKGKVVANPHNILFTTNVTGVINGVYNGDVFVPYLQMQLQRTNAECIVILDSASAHISVAVLAALRMAALRHAVIPGGRTMFVQSIDTALAALYRTAHHRLYAAHMEGNPKVTAPQARNLFVESCYTGHRNAVNLLDVPTLFQDLGYIDPTKLKLRVPFQFAIPQRAEPRRRDASAPKPKPKPNPKPVSRQLSMSAFLSKKPDQVAMVLQEILVSAFCVATSHVKNCMRDIVLEV